MDSIQLNVLNALIKYDRNVFSLKEEFNITEEQIQLLIEKKLVKIFAGEGFCGGIRNLCLTPKGHELIQGYCSTCECIPCDCGYGS
tara:strand:- start:106 stop:363 length:258 start_codon:yes stop_codon:yes gene_type:complete